MTLTTLLYLLNLTTFAGLGRPIHNETLPNAICKLTLKKQENQFHCTGSLISKNLVKTAGHCLQGSQLVSIECHSGEELSIISVERFPQYRHQLLRREERNRWFDHALVTVKKAQKTNPIQLIKTENEFIKLKNDFDECLLVGYGIQENRGNQTGFLKGVSYPPSFLSYENELIYSKGAYLFELMPGDSGGPLLCRKQNRWLDLGTASAHDWDHNSLYAPNFAAQSWFEENIIKTENGTNEAVPTQTSLQTLQGPIHVGQYYRLLPYSVISTEKGPLYNGDLSDIVARVTQIEGSQIHISFNIFSASNFFLCSEVFPCYGDTIEGTVKTSDLIQ